MADDERPGRPDGAVAVVRRAPFSDNPRVGARGQRTQQRILDAALRAFGEEGYHGCSIDQITKLARCSRVSFYQYFANKEDVFRQLAGQVARQVSASTEALDPLTADLDGWAALRAWVVALRRDPRSVRAGVPCVRERRGPRRRGPPDRRGDHHEDPRPLGDDDVAAPAARPGDPAAPRVPEPHARRQRHTAFGHVRTDVSGRPDIEARAHRRDAPHVVRRARRRERARARRCAAAGARVRLGDARTAPARQVRSIRMPPNNRVLDALLDVGTRRVRRARLPQHTRRRSRRRRRRLARRVLPVLPQQGTARAHAHRRAPSRPWAPR